MLIAKKVVMWLHAHAKLPSRGCKVQAFVYDSGIGVQKRPSGRSIGKERHLNQNILGDSLVYSKSRSKNPYSEILFEYSAQKPLNGNKLWLGPGLISAVKVDKLCHFIPTLNFVCPASNCGREDKVTDDLLSGPDWGEHLGWWDLSGSPNQDDVFGKLLSKRADYLPILQLEVYKELQRQCQNHYLRKILSENIWSKKDVVQKGLQMWLPLDGGREDLAQDLRYLVFRLCRHAGVKFLPNF